MGKPCVLTKLPANRRDLPAARPLLSGAPMDPFLVFGVALLLGQRAAVAPWITMLVAGGVMLLLRAQLSPWIRVASFVVFLLGALLAQRSIRDYARCYHDTLARFGAPARCEAMVRVRSSPVGTADTLAWSGEAPSLWCEGRTLPGPWMLRLYGETGEPTRGDDRFVVADVAPVQLFHNPDLPNPYAGAARRRVELSGGLLSSDLVRAGWGPGAAVDRLRAYVRRRIRATYPAAAAPLGRALVLGETGIDREDDEAFRRSGLAHLLAVSGTHLVLVVLGAVAAWRWLLLRWTWLAARGDVNRLASAAGAMLAIVYADFAGGSGSAWRAAVMVGVSLLARSFGRRSTGPRAFGLSLVVLGLWDPLAAFDASLLLSAAATWGLLYLARPLSDRLAPRLPTPVRPLASVTATTLAASLACAPILATLSPNLPWFGVVTNLLAVPLGEAAALPLCMFHTVLAPLPVLEGGVARVGSGALLALRFLAHVSARPRWAAVPVPPPTEVHYAVLAWTIAAWWSCRPGRRMPVILAGAAAWLVAEAVAIRVGTPRRLLRITALDVAQGDALLVDFPDGQLMAIDAGGMVGSPVDPGERVVWPTLRARRRSRVDVAVLTHPHPDHFLGFVTTLPHVDVGAFWDTDQGRTQGAGDTYARLMASLAARGVPLRAPADLCGHLQRFGEAAVDVLAPCPAFDPDASANDNSFVLRITFGERSALLVGDAEAGTEQTLLGKYGNHLQSDLLKLGHHGSRTSTTLPFLATVRPVVAVVSAGVRNRFGHPHPTTLATLERAGVPLARTDRGGAFVWETDGKQVRMRRPLASKASCSRVRSHDHTFRRLRPAFCLGARPDRSRLPLRHHHAPLSCAR